jgi:hypothetical protein
LLRQDFPTALSRLGQAAQLLPTHVGTWHVLAWTQLLTGDINGAERTFLHALELNRNFGESHGGLAAVAALRGERSKAEHLVAIARRLDSTSLSPEIVDALFAGRRGDAKLVRQILQGILAKAGSGTAAGLMKDFHPMQLKH